MEENGSTIIEKRSFIIDAEEIRERAKQFLMQGEKLSDDDILIIKRKLENLPADTSDEDVDEALLECTALRFLAKERLNKISSI